MCFIPLEFDQEKVETLQRRGNVLLPVHPCGALFELIAIIHDYIHMRGFVETPMHVVSPVAKRSLHLANIQGEW